MQDHRPEKDDVELHRGEEGVVRGYLHRGGGNRLWSAGGRHGLRCDIRQPVQPPLRQHQSQLKLHAFLPRALWVHPKFLWVYTGITIALRSTHGAEQQAT